jgi:cell division protein FtsL
MIWRCSLNKAANTYWADARLSAQRPAPRAFPSSLGTAIGTRERTRASSRRRPLVSPMWAFTTVIVAMLMLCVTVTLRTQTTMHRAVMQHETINSEVETLRSANANLIREVESLRTEPRVIEAAARTRLGMVRANEIIVPVD